MEDYAPPEAGPATLSPSEIWKMLRVQWKVIVSFLAVVLILALVGNLLAQKRYRSTAVIQIASRAGQELQVDEVVDFDRMAQERTYAKTQLDLLQSRDLREEVIRRYEALGLDDLTLADGGAARLGRMLSVSQRKDTELVDVSVTDTDPERAARLANLVTEVYREQNLDGRRDSASEAKVWLKQQLGEYKQRIADEIAALLAYQEQHDLADAEEEVTRLSSTMHALNVAYGEVKTERVLLETTARGHERLLAAGDYASLAKDMDTPLLLALAEEYSSAVTENAQIAARYLERMPERVYSEAKQERIRLELREEVERTLIAERANLEILRAKEQSLAAEIDEAMAQLLARQALGEEYERLKLTLERSKQFYATLSQRDAELELAARTHLSNVRVIDEARPKLQAVSPNILANMAIALILGVIGGAIVGFLVEYLDDTISSPFDVSTYLRVPYLGIVPRLGDDAESDRARALYIQEHRTSLAAEAVRAIRTVLDLNPEGKTLRRVLVTSSYTSEGKTNTVVNLAVSFAILGRRVLVLDADMRRPRLHHIFGLPKEGGLSAVLKGGAALDGAIVSTGIPNLDVLPAGHDAEGPNELLASVGMVNLLAELDQRYDMILIDTPPSGGLSDAAILSKLVDGVVFVVREKTVSRWLVRDVVYRLQQIGARILGVVVNDVDLTSRNSKYSYQYEYRYRYTDEDGPRVAAK